MTLTKWTERPVVSGVRGVAADDMDRILHAERLGPGRTKRTYREHLSRLPAGVMVADDKHCAFLVHERGLLRWTPGGYATQTPQDEDVEVYVLTPRSVVMAITGGFPPELHPSASTACCS